MIITVKNLNTNEYEDVDVFASGCEDYYYELNTLPTADELGIDTTDYLGVIMTYGLHERRRWRDIPYPEIIEELKKHYRIADGLIIENRIQKVELDKDDYDLDTVCFAFYNIKPEHI